MDEHYDPKHKASSVSSTVSTTSTNTNDTAPSLYSTTSSIGGDFEDFGPLEGFGLTTSLSIPVDDDYCHVYKQHQTVCADSDAVLDTFLDMEPLTSLTIPSRKRRTSDASSTMSNEVEEQHQDKRTRELLTDEERRANHIASEKKRRTTIRTGFKDLTDIIPTLKNINNSKSTILFNAVEYVRHLEKRNRNLREKLASLQLRLEVEGRLGRSRRNLLPATMTPSNTSYHRHSVVPHLSSPSPCLAPDTIAALMAHKKQQRQLELLQEQLRLQQELLAKHNIAYPSASHISIPSSSSSFSNSPFFSSGHNALDAPSLNIPADDDHHGSELARHKSLLNCHHRQYRSS